MDGGRGEPIRLVLSLANIPFEDERLAFADFSEKRPHYPFQAVPVAEIDGDVMAQTNSLLRYFGRQCGLYPEDLKQALRCDEMMDALEDLSNHIGQSFGLKGEAQKAARQKLIEEKFRPYFKTFEARLNHYGSDYVAGDALSVADLKLFAWAGTIKRGVLDHVPTDFIDKEAPRVAALVQRVSQLPAIVEFYKR